MSFSDSFEFYLYHFSHYLLHVGSTGNTLAWTSTEDAVYPTLLEDYLGTFLPCDGTVPPTLGQQPVAAGGSMFANK